MEFERFSAIRDETLAARAYLAETSTDGRSVTVEATDPIGSPRKPLSNAQFEAKFRDCARNAVRPLSEASVDGLLAAIGRMETLPDARALLAPFAE